MLSRAANLRLEVESVSIAEEVQTGKKINKAKKRYYRKHTEFFRLIQKVKLWPSRKGVLHGIRSLKVMGGQAEVVTHCDESFIINNSQRSRAARWFRNKWFTDV